MRVRLSIACVLGAALTAAATSAVGATLTEDAKLTASDGAAEDYFGRRVTIDGHTAVVGAYSADVGVNMDQGAAYIFERDAGGPDNWGEVNKLTASDGAVGDFFGSSVSLNGDTLVVGAYFDESMKGSAYIFGRDVGGPDNWGEVKKLTASDGASGALFGVAVSVSGDTVVVAASSADVGGDSDQGAAYVFDRNAGGPDNWGEVKKLTASDGAADDRIESVSVSGDTIVAGARWADVGGNSDQGAAYVFERDAGGPDNWGELKKLTASDGGSGQRFGLPVFISGDVVVAGGSQFGFNQSAAYVFERNAGGSNAWGQVAKLFASDGTLDDWFGSSVSASGDTVAVGAEYGDSERGAAYLFERHAGGPDAWGEIAKITASDGQGNDRFGGSACMSGVTVVVGAKCDEVGSNNNQGSAYVYALDQPPVGVDDGGSGFITDEDTPFTTGDVLANDFDPDVGDTLSVASLDTASTLGTVMDNGDGTFYYDPNGQFDYLAVGESADDTFRYIVRDNEGRNDLATVTITVSGVNDSPTASDDGGVGFETDEDTAFTTGSVLVNDTDVDASDTLSVSDLDIMGALGLVTDNADGTFDYDPNGQFEALAAGESSTDAFTYTVSDGNGGVDTATVTVTVTGANEPRGCGDGGCGAAPALALAALFLIFMRRRRPHLS